MSRLDELIQELCPDGVEYKKVKDLCHISRGVVISKDYIRDNPGEYPVYSSQTENDGILGCISSYRYDGEYLTWTTDGANAGTVFCRTGKFNITNVCGLLEVKDNSVLLRFLYYVVNNEAPKHVNKGMGNPKLMSNQMEMVEVPAPPLEVQREIVRVLDHFTLLRKELSAELSARRKQYEYYRDELLTFGDDVPMVTLPEISENCDSQRKPVTKGKREAGEYPYYGASGIVDYVADYLFDGDYLLISEDGANLTARVTPIAFSISGKNWVNNHAHILKFEDENVRKFVEIYLNGMDLSSFISGGAQPKLNQANLNKIQIPFPGKESIAEIVSVLENFDALCNDISSGLPAEIEARQKQYEYYRDRLLSFPRKETA